MLYSLKRCLRMAVTAGLLVSGMAWGAQGYVYSLSGDVQAAIGTHEPVKVEKNQQLIDNVIITTGPNSSAVLKFIDGTVIVLDEKTAFQIQRYNYDAKAPSKIAAQFAMLRGGLRSITGEISSKNRQAYKLATPLATISIHGTDFVALLSDKLYVSVKSGAIVVSNAAGAAAFAAGQSMAVANATTAPISITAGPTRIADIMVHTVPANIPAPVPVATAGTAGAFPLAPVVPGVGTAVAAAAAAIAAVAGNDSTTSHATTTHH